VKLVVSRVVKLVKLTLMHLELVELNFNASARVLQGARAALLLALLLALELNFNASASCFTTSFTTS
jgi:hypothetical protein